MRVRATVTLRARARARARVGVSARNLGRVDAQMSDDRADLSDVAHALAVLVEERERLLELGNLLVGESISHLLSRVSGFRRVRREELTVLATFHAKKARSENNKIESRPVTFPAADR